jgi:hypothetical protein
MTDCIQARSGAFSSGNHKCSAVPVAAGLDRCVRIQRDRVGAVRNVREMKEGPSGSTGTRTSLCSKGIPPGKSFARPETAAAYLARPAAARAVAKNYIVISITYEFAVLF